MGLLIIASDCDTTNILFNFIEPHYPIDAVIIERRPHHLDVIKKKLKNYGFFNTCGQILFILYYKIIHRLSHNRIEQILNNHQLNCNKIPLNKIIHIDSINDKSEIVKILNFKPDLILVNGTSLIKKDIIQLLPPMINIHTGITPKYRGIHGGYWALVKNDLRNCGTTIHKINAGIDTGDVLAQTFIQPQPMDNVSTLPYLQYASALPKMLLIIKNYFQNKELESLPYDGALSRLFTHPTIGEYFYFWWKSKIK